MEGLNKIFSTTPSSQTPRRVQQKRNQKNPMRKKPKKDGAMENNEKTKIGYSLSCAARMSLATSISEEGDGLGKSCAGSLSFYNGTRTISTLGFGISSDTTKGKILPTDPGAYITNDRFSVELLSGMQKFQIPPSKSSSVFLTTGSTTILRREKVTAGRPDQILYGVPSGSSVEEKYLWGIDKELNILGHLKLGRGGWGMFAGPSFHSGISYLDKYSLYNNVEIKLMLMFGPEYIPDISIKENKDAERDALSAIQAIYDIVLAMKQREWTSNILSLPQDKLAEGGVPSGTSSTPNALWNTSALMAISSFISAGAGDDLNYSKKLFLLLTAIKGIGGIYSLTGEGSAERASGLTEIFLTGGRLLTIPYNIESPSSRRGRDSKEIESDLLKINFISFGMYGAATFLGAAGGSNTWMRAGPSATLSLALNPDPLGREDFVKSNSYTYVPWTSRDRSGFCIDKDVMDNYYSSACLFTRLGKSSAGEDPTSSTIASVGIKIKKGPAVLKIGPYFASHFGGGEGEIAGFGGRINPKLAIPVIKENPEAKTGECGVEIGLIGTAGVTMPSGSFEKEVAFLLGFYCGKTTR